MTGFGWGSLVAGAAVLATGIAGHWRPVVVLGIGILVLLAGSVAYVGYRPRLAMTRSVEPPRVEKGRPAIALIEVTNLSGRPLPPLTIEQRVGDQPVAARLPRLRAGEQALRTYRLPTSARGTYQIGPVEMPRADPFGLCRTIRRMGSAQEISVHPRLLHLRPLPAGASRHLEGPSSDLAPQGSVTFHGLREYAVGDDLRMVHWLSTARHGKLVVRHHVDTAQPYTVVLLDLDPGRYSAAALEEAVDVAASVSVSLSAGKAPVQLRTTSGERLGGPVYRDPAVIVDRLTDLLPTSGSLADELATLRRERGGTALVVVTGSLDAGVLPSVAAMRRRFGRVIVVSVLDSPGRPPAHPGITVIEASTADEMARRWNAVVAR